MFALFWPFDWSCSGIAFTGFLVLVWILYLIGQAASAAVDVAKKVVEDETVQDIGKGFFAAWLDSTFDDD
jgi:hypothetical protein